MKILNPRIDDDPWMLEDEHYLRSSRAPFSESVQKLHSCHPRSILGSMLVRCSLWCCCGNQAWQSQRLVLLVHPNKQEKDGMLGSNVSMPRGLVWGPTIVNWTGINHRNKLKEDKPTSVSINSFFKFSYFFTSSCFPGHVLQSQLGCLPWCFCQEYYPGRPRNVSHPWKKFASQRMVNGS